MVSINPRFPQAEKIRLLNVYKKAHDRRIKSEGKIDKTETDSQQLKENN